MRFNLREAPDPCMARMSPLDARDIRWLYRSLRRYGKLDRSTARMAVHSAFHCGYRTGMAER